MFCHQIGLTFSHACLYAAKGRLPLLLASVVSDQRFILHSHLVLNFAFHPINHRLSIRSGCFSGCGPGFLQPARRIQTSTRPACLGTQQLYSAERAPVCHVENAATFQRAHVCVLRDVCEVAPQGVKCLSDALIAAERREAF